MHYLKHNVQVHSFYYLHCVKKILRSLTFLIFEINVHQNVQKYSKNIPGAVIWLFVYVNDRAYFSNFTYDLSARPEYILRMSSRVAGRTKTKTTCQGTTTCHRLQPRRPLTFHRFRSTFFLGPPQSTTLRLSRTHRQVFRWVDTCHIHVAAPLSLPFVSHMCLLLEGKGIHTYLSCA